MQITPVRNNYTTNKTQNVNFRAKTNTLLTSIFNECKNIIEQRGNANNVKYFNSCMASLAEFGKHFHGVNKPLVIKAKEKNGIYFITAEISKKCSKPFMTCTPSYVRSEPENFIDTFINKLYTYQCRRSVRCADFSNRPKSARQKGYGII